MLAHFDVSKESVRSKEEIFVPLPTLPEKKSNHDKNTAALLISFDSALHRYHPAEDSIERVLKRHDARRRQHCGILAKRMPSKVAAGRIHDAVALHVFEGA